MPIKRTILHLTICVIFITFFSFSGCRKFCNHFYYNFNGTASFYPEKDSINVGDTIWFASTIPTKLLDANSNQSIDYSGASYFGTDVTFNPISMPDPTIGAVDSFVFVSLKGTISTNQNLPHAGKTITYLEENGNYKLSFAIVALKKGVYVVTLHDIQYSKKDCSSANITMTLSNTDKHQHYLQTIYYPGSPFEDSIPSMEQTHSYCFKVY